MSDPVLIDVTPQNVAKRGLFCLKNTKHPGFKAKQAWFEERYEDGLRLRLVLNEEGKQAGFIEFVPAEMAWRPVDAPGYLFIHCLFIYGRENAGKGFASALIQSCVDDAQRQGKSGVAATCSEGSWLTGKRVFLAQDFVEVDHRERYDLVARKLDPNASDATLLDWTRHRSEFSGWNLLYTDQCPYHDRSATELVEMARSFEVKLNVTKLTTAREAQRGPTGFGTYAVLRDGRVLEDHYISKGRFRNILRKELGL
jgi:hypothetical protein